MRRLVFLMRIRSIEFYDKVWNMLSKVSSDSQEINLLYYLLTTPRRCKLSCFDPVIGKYREEKLNDSYNNFRIMQKFIITIINGSFCIKVRTNLHRFSTQEDWVSNWLSTITIFDSFVFSLPILTLLFNR